MLYHLASILLLVTLIVSCTEKTGHSSEKEQKIIQSKVSNDENINKKHTKYGELYLDYKIDKSNLIITSCSSKGIDKNILPDNCK
ncbi:hypothetical protein CDV26_08605 [Francisella halioticida]|uniref:Lipoprotein n=1 Tax=Francisella halioticida TaxID=549298 RepID=A0ABM6M0K9_9GAMM|nr:hypothetical protein [Francisella halioticida]ASG68446.1 hypothetical protein CDV26_08605 [Francisella halioticida]